jgi:hypothetical protein
MSVQAGNLIAANIYRASDKPLYHRGNSVLIGVNVLAIALFLATKAYYVAENRRRARRWEELGEEGRKVYLRETRDEGNKRLDFRFL